MDRGTMYTKHRIESIRDRDARRGVHKKIAWNEGTLPKSRDLQLVG